MRAPRLLVLACALALLPVAARTAAPEPKLPPQKVDPATPVDHDGQPIQQPKERDINLYGHQLREALIEPMSHIFDIPDRLLDVTGHGRSEPAANVDAFDEVANSSWFTNRNHVRALTPDAVRLGGEAADLVPTPPYTIKARKSEGVNAGFTIKDAKGKRWIVKLDKPGYPQLGSGADVVVDRLFWAAGYNVSHDVVFTFTRDQLKIDDDLRKGDKKHAPFADDNLDTLLTRGDRRPDGRYFGQASLYLEGKPVGPIDMRRKRKDDPNDRFTHKNRRELRGYYVLCSWVGNWDTKDQQSLDTFVETKDSLGFVRHNVIDFGASLGAAAEGPRSGRLGYEYTVDGKWMALRFITLGFVQEPWRKIPTDVPVPSLGNFESAVYSPEDFRMLQPHPAFRERRPADEYWGAKLVASFSDAQIAAAIDAAGYEDPRVKPALLQLLIARREKVLRYYFDRIAPLDFYEVQDGALRFRDLAVDRRLVPARAYEVEIEAKGVHRRLTLTSPSLPLSDLGAGAGEAELEFHVAGSHAAPVTVHLRRGGNSWQIVRVQHA